MLPSRLSNISYSKLIITGGVSYITELMEHVISCDRKLCWTAKTYSFITPGSKKMLLLFLFSSSKQLYKACSSLMKEKFYHLQSSENAYCVVGLYVCC